MEQHWDRRSGEPMLWFARFELYRELGTGRTIEDVWRLNKAQQSVPSTSKRPHNRWYEVAQEWDWKGRAEAWDEEQIAQQRAVTAQEALERRQRESAEREKARQNRRSLLNGFLGKLSESLINFPDGSKLDELTKATQMVVQELRAEYNDLPVQRIGFMNEEDLDVAIEQEFERLLRGSGEVAGLAGDGEGAAA
ncbi:MAG: hypothetical protein JXA21_20760 [Anaerolineae bacterium]|nr:hypothetical protein [Anaerolineae bacterium]